MLSTDDSPPHFAAAAAGFGEAGQSRLLFQAQGEAYAMALLPDGQDRLAGSAGDSPSSDFALARVRL